MLYKPVLSSATQQKKHRRLQDIHIHHVCIMYVFTQGILKVTRAPDIVEELQMSEFDFLNQVDTRGFVPAQQRGSHINFGLPLKFGEELHREPQDIYACM